MSSLKGGSACKSTRCKGWRDGDWTKCGDLTLQVFWSCMTWELFCIGSSHDSWAVVSITMSFHLTCIFVKLVSWKAPPPWMLGSLGEPLLLSRLVWESLWRPCLSRSLWFGSEEVGRDTEHQFRQARRSRKPEVKEHKSQRQSEIFLGLFHRRSC